MILKSPFGSVKDPWFEFLTVTETAPTPSLDEAFFTLPEMVTACANAVVIEKINVVRSTTEKLRLFLIIWNLVLTDAIIFWI